MSIFLVPLLDTRWQLSECWSLFHRLLNFFVIKFYFLIFPGMKNATWPCRHKVPYPAMQTHRQKSPHANFPPTSQCQDFLYNSERKTEILLFYCRLTFAAFRSAVELCYEYSNYITLTVILVLVVFVLYKSYWCPVLYVKVRFTIMFFTLVHMISCYMYI